MFTRIRKQISSNQGHELLEKIDKKCYHCNSDCAFGFMGDIIINLSINNS